RQRGLSQGSRVDADPPVAGTAHMNRPRAEFLAETTVAFTVNGRNVSSRAAPIARLADVLRDELGLTGTKVGCNAGDCGACTVLLEGKQVCACLVPVAQAKGCKVVTVEG